MNPRPTSLRLWVKEGRTYHEIQNGPFPITPEQLSEARALYAAEYASAKPLTGARIAPQTTARDILAKVAPQLSAFDALMVGFAVTNSRIRFEAMS